MVCGGESAHMILSRDEIENIAEEVLKDFREYTGINTYFTPIEQLAKNYLGLEVRFAKLSNDGKLCGLTAYEDTKLKLEIDGEIKVLEIKKNQIIMDSDFIDPSKVRELCGKRRFTLAHEISHHILFSMQSEEEKIHLTSQYSKRQAHTARELKTAEDWNEWQANALGAALLMPRTTIAFMVAEIESLMKQNDLNSRYFLRLVISIMTEAFKVSMSAATIRLKTLGYTELLGNRALSEVQYV